MAPGDGSASHLAATHWIALDDCDEENGTLFVLPDRQAAQPLLADSQEAIESFQAGGTEYGFDVRMDPAAGEGAARYVYNLRAGQVAFHRALTPHGSFANVSRRWRRVLSKSSVAASLCISCRSLTKKVSCTAFNYISAEAAALGPMNYADFADGSPFPKECERRTRLPPARPRADFLSAQISWCQGRTPTAAASGAARSRRGPGTRGRLG